MPRRCGFYPGICLTTEEKARKNLSQVSFVSKFVSGPRRKPNDSNAHFFMTHFNIILVCFAYMSVVNEPEYV